ncbi:zinc finger protein 678 [Eurosta solidaginis]|uniref:zinc finger protein 678 n=1 Tax=Eurosta solidaginis TaxID=178769 RepID=UPI0035311CBB
MCTLSALKCPLCAQPNFANIEALRISLIKAANGPLACPICQELILGLDKLTIHLFSHTNDVPIEIPSGSTKTESFGLTDTNRTKIDQIVKMTPLNSEIKLKADYFANSSLIKLTSEENKTNTRHLIRDELKVVEKLNLNSSCNVLPAESNTIPNKMSDNNISICDICEFTFRDKELLDLHFRLVHENSDLGTNGIPFAEPAFKCHLCAKKFKMKGSLRVHLKVVHQMCLPYMSNSPKLSICDRIRQRGTNIGKTGNKIMHCLAQTVKKDNSCTKMLCPSVIKPMQQQQSPTTHQVTNAFSCGTLALLPTSKVTSEKLVHAVSGATLNSNVLFVVNTNQDALPNQESRPLVSNGTTESKLIVNGEKDLFDLKQKNTTENTKIWKCNECAKAFTTKYFLKKHKRLHTGEMPYTCEICARTFTFQQSYHKHLLYHNNEKPHVCSTCGRAFKELSTLHNHERIHSGEKPFKCEICGKCFRQRVSFLVHTRIHTGIMPYRCDTCQKSFRYKVSQRTHKCQEAQCTPNKNVVENNYIKSLPEQTTDEISESFIKEFLDNTTVNMSDPQNLPADAEITVITNTERNCNGHGDEELLTKTIDDIIIESCNKMGIDVQPVHTTDDTGVLLCGNDCNSTTQKLQNMRLYSPQFETSIPDSGGDNTDNLLQQFLWDDMGNNIFSLSGVGVPRVGL